MKNIFYSVIFASLALVSAACQKADEKALKTSSKTVFTVTGSIVNFDDSKVSYAFSDAANPEKGLKTKWEVNDVIFGYDDKDGEFTFKVVEVNEGVATFSGSYTPGEGATELYAVYYPVLEEKVAELLADLKEDGELAVDLSAQDGKLGSNTPAIMCATGTISGDRIHFSFTNQTAIVGLYRMRIFDGGKTAEENTAISGVSLNGVSTKGTIKIEDNVFYLVPGDETGDIAASGLDLSTDGNGDIIVPTDGSGTISPYFAVIPSPSSNFTVTASNNEKSYTTTGSISGNIEAGKYYQIGKKIGIPVASLTVGDKTTDYFTIDDALSAINGRTCTIKLLANCSMTAKRNLVQDEKLTLDLNNCTLTVDGTDRINVQSSSASLVIKDESFGGGGKYYQKTYSEDTPTYAVSVGYGGTFTLESGAIYAAQAGIQIQKGTANIKGGEIHSQKEGDAIYCSQNNSEVNIDSGVIAAEGRAVYVRGGRANINGGTISSVDSAGIAIGIVSSTSEYSPEVTITTTEESPTVISSDKARAVYIRKGKLTIEGGTFNVSKSQALIFGNQKVDSYTVVIKGGYFNVTGTYAVIYAYGSGSTEISGGYFKRDGEGTYGIIYKGGTGNRTVTLTGGHFSDNKNLTDWNIPDGYELKDDGSDGYKYYVEKISQ